jgi:hypothetical protein
LIQRLAESVALDSLRCQRQKRPRLLCRCLITLKSRVVRSLLISLVSELHAKAAAAVDSTAAAAVEEVVVDLDAAAVVAVDTAAMAAVVAK